MRLPLKSREEIDKLYAANQVVCQVLNVLEENCVPGASTWDLNEIAAAEIDKHKVKSAFLGYYGYPAVLCTSINHVVVHGIPRKDEVLEDGDIIGIDFGVFKEGYCGDSARTVLVGNVAPERKKLVEVTRQALALAIENAVIGKRLGDIGHAVQQFVESHGFSVVRQFVGHGIGRRMHEDPPVPNYGEAGTGKRLKRGLVIAIEPMVNAGTHEVDVLDDEWTAVTKDRSMSAHFEHSVAITDDGPVVLSRC